MTEDEIIQATTLGFTGPIWDGEEEQTHEQVNPELLQTSWEAITIHSRRSCVLVPIGALI